MERERIYDGKVSKVNALSRSEGQSQEEVCIQFSQAEGNGNVVLFSTSW